MRINFNINRSCHMFVTGNYIIDGDQKPSKKWGET